MSIVYGIGGLIRTAPNPIAENRAPTNNDRGDIGQLWIDQTSGAGYLRVRSGNLFTWINLGSISSPLQTINGENPVANNINLIDQGGNGAITVTAPGSGGAGTVGLAVNVDGVTVSIVGDQLVAIGSTRLVGVDTFAGPGTNPVVPTAGGLITVTGAQVAAGVNPIRTNSIAANSYEIQVQRSQAVAGSTIANNGICHFDSAMFTVDGNGFVQLAGGGIAFDEINVQAVTAPGVTPVLPSASGALTLSGAAVAAAGIPIQSRSIALNQLQIEVQRAATSAVTNATAQGIASFDSTQFTADANGFVQLLGTSSGTATTVGAVTADVITFAMPLVADVTTFDIIISGFNTTLGQGVGYSIFGTVRTTGAAAVLVGVPDKISNEEGGSVTADANLVVSANNAIVRVTGVAGSAINWRASLRSVTV